MVGSRAICYRELSQSYLNSISNICLCIQSFQISIQAGWIEVQNSATVSLDQPWFQAMGSNVVYKLLFFNYIVWVVFWNCCFKLQGFRGLQTLCFWNPQKSPQKSPQTNPQNNPPTFPQNNLQKNPQENQHTNPRVKSPKNITKQMTTYSVATKRVGCTYIILYILCIKVYHML